MPLSRDDIQNYLERLDIHRRSIQHHLKQESYLGPGYVTQQITHGLDEARKEIRHIKGVLRRNGVPVDNHPVDVARVYRKRATVPKAPKPRKQRTKPLSVFAHVIKPLIDNPDLRRTTIFYGAPLLGIFFGFIAGYQTAAYQFIYPDSPIYYLYPVGGSVIGGGVGYMIYRLIYK